MANQNGNGTTESKVKGLLDVLHDEWTAAGKKSPDGKAAKALVDAWEKADKATAAAEAAYKAALAAESKCVADIVRARGKGRINIRGVNCTPMSRGETVYFRKESAEVEKFG